MGLPADERQAALLAAAELGLGWLRLPVAWDRLESRPGEVRWEVLDAVIDGAGRAGLRVLLAVQGAPSWARQDPEPPAHWWLCPAAEREPQAAAPPTRPQDLARFVQRLGRRYGQRVAALEIWPEPNRLPAWRAGGPDPADYARLLQAVAPAARAAAPTWTLVSGGLAPIVVEASPVCYQSDLVFLDRLAAAGALSQVDAVGVQPLGLEADAQEPPAAAALNFRRAELLRRVLLRHGLDAMPLWLTAAGWQAGGPRAAASGATAWSSEAAAAEFADGWRLAREAWPWAGPIMLAEPVRWRVEGPELEPTNSRPPPAPLDAWPALAAAIRQAAAADPPPAHRDAAAAAAAAEAGRRRALSALALALLSLGGLLILGRPRPQAAAGAAGVALAPDPPPPSTAAALLGLAALLANAWLPPWPGLGALALLALIALRDPRCVLLLAAGSLPWRDVLRLQLLARPILPFEGLLLLALGGVLGAALLTRIPGARPIQALPRARPAAGVGRRREVGAVLLLVAWAGLSAAWAAELRPAWFEWRTVIVEPALFFLLLRRLSADWSAQRRLLQALVLGAALAAGQGLLGSAASALGARGLELPAVLGQAVAAEGVLRAKGPYGSPNNLALWLGRTLPLGLAWLAARRSARRRLLPPASAALAIACGLGATFSRGSWLLGLPTLFLVGGIAWWDLWRRAPDSSSETQAPPPEGNAPAEGTDRRPPSGASDAPRPQQVLAIEGASAPRRAVIARWRGPAWGLLLLTLTLVLFLLPALGSRRLAGTLSLEPGSTASIRWRLWQSSGRMIMDHPWLGVGPDNFLPAYRDRYVQRDVIQERALNHPHNVVLDWATRLGWPGLVLGLVLLGAAVGTIRAALLRPDLSTAERAWAWGLAGAQAYALAHGLVDNHFFLVDLAVAQWLLLAAAQALAARPPLRQVQPVKGRPT